MTVFCLHLPEHTHHFWSVKTQSHPGKGLPENIVPHLIKLIRVHNYSHRRNCENYKKHIRRIKIIHMIRTER